MQTSSSRRDKTRPSSSENRRTTTAKKATGCMSGILHLLSRHSRKRLPSGKKAEKAVLTPGRLVLPPEKTLRWPPDNNDVPSRSDYSTTHVVTTAPANTATPTPIVELRRHSYETPRSPTLPPELRRPPGSPAADSPRRSPALVARLMGLDEMVLVQSPDSAAEKRRRLMGALEKCSEDLNALKRIIEAVQLDEAKRKPVVVVPNGNGTKLMDGGDANGQQPSPVSVLDAFSGDRSDIWVNSPIQCGSPFTAVRSRIRERPPLPGSFFSDPCEHLTARLNRAGGHHMKKTWNTCENRYLVHRIVIQEPLPAPERREYMSVEEFGFPRTKESGPRRCRGRRSRAMVEAVGEVWEDGVWEERQEFGRVGFELETAIFGVLVEEMVVAYLCKISSPLRTSRKRLYF